MTAKTLALGGLLALAQLLTGMGPSVATAEEPNAELQLQAPQHPNLDVSNLMDASLGSIDETYRGQHQFFNDDLLGNFIATIMTALNEHVLNPFLNGLMSGNPVCLVIAGILGVVVIGFFLRLGAKFCDSLMTTSPAPSQAQNAIKS